MGLKEIEKEIRKSGEQEIKKIEEENRRILEEINKSVQEEAERSYKQTKLKRSKELGVIPKKIISDANMLKRKRINAKKTEILEAVFSEAKRKILKMSEKEKKKILENLIVSSTQGMGDYLILVDKKYAGLLKGNKNVEVGKDINDFGVVIESKDGSLIVDSTLSNVIEGIRLKLEPEIVRILFQIAK